MSDVTRILERAQAGDSLAAEALLPLVYVELRRLAASKMANEIPGQTLQPTALVHEAWLRLSQQSEARWQNREHFYAVAAEVMRRILVDRPRRRKAPSTVVTLNGWTWTRSNCPAFETMEERSEVGGCVGRLFKWDL